MGEDKALRKARNKLDRAIEANRYDEALTLLAELRTAEPNNARWPHKHGDLLRKLGRNDDAIACYEQAVSLYAAQGFIARAVAMAKTVVALNPARLDILERVDPQAAQQLRAHKRAPHPILDDGPLPPLPPAAPSPLSPAPQRLSPDAAFGQVPRARPGPAPQPRPARDDAAVPFTAAVAGQSLRAPQVSAAKTAPGQGQHPQLSAAQSHSARAPTAQPARAPQPLANPSLRAPNAPGGASPAPRAQPTVTSAARAHPPAQQRSPGAGPAPLPIPGAEDRVPPRTRKRRASTTIELELEDLYGDTAGVLSADPHAPPDQTRFSNDSTRQTAELRLSDVELDKRAPVPEGLSQRQEPPPAETLASLPLFPLFAEMPKGALRRMIASAELVELSHGASVLRKGDAADALYGIVEGSVNVIVPGQDFQLTLAEGDVFGESALLEADTYHADVVVMGTLVALRVPRDVLLDIVSEHAPLAGLLLELLTRRLLGNLLQVSPLFHDFDARGKGEIARLFEVRRAAAGTMLAVLGKKMDGLYISLTGSLRINQPGAPERLAPPGSMFGQNTFLTQSASQVDVIAQSDMILLRLPQAQFTRVAMQYPTVLARLAELSTSEVVRVTM